MPDVVRRPEGVSIGPDVVIRAVGPEDDFDAISRIYALSWKAAYRGIVPDAYLDALPLTRWAPIVRGNPDGSTVLMEGARYVGTSCVCAARDARMDGWGEIVSLYLLPEAMGVGYGRMMLQHSVARLRGMGFDRVYLWVLEANARARAFYARNGFVATPDTMDVDIGGKRLTEVRYSIHVPE